MARRSRRTGVSSPLPRLPAPLFRTTPPGSMTSSSISAERRTAARVSISSTGKQANGPSGVSGLAISADGGFVAFVSKATDLVPGDTNGQPDIFVRDRELGKTERADLGPGGKQADDVSFSLSPSTGGRFVAFASYASNLVPGDTNGVSDVFVRAR